MYDIKYYHYNFMVRYRTFSFNSTLFRTQQLFDPAYSVYYNL